MDNTLTEKRNLDLYRTFVAQQALYNNLSVYENLFELIKRKSFDAIADRLVSIYANRSDDVKKLQIKNLFLVWLALAPVLEKQRYSYKIAWTKSNFFSFLGFYTNQIHKYYYIGEQVFEVYNSSKLSQAFEKLNVVDKKFIKFAKEVYLNFYGSNSIFGSAAKSIFNKIFFALEEQKNDFVYLVRNNKLLMLSVKPFAESKNITKEPIRAWDYQIQKVLIKNKNSTKREMKTIITISKETSNEFKKQTQNCKNEKQLFLICSSFCEKHKYVFSAIKRFQELNAFLQDKRKIKFKHNVSLIKIYTEKSQKIESLPAQVTSPFLPSIFSKNYKEISEDAYFHSVFNLYKEL